MKHVLYKKIRLSFLISLLVIMLISLFSLYIARAQNFALRKHYSKLIAKLLENTNESESQILFEKIIEAQNSIPLLRMEMWIFDQNGKILYAGNQTPFPYAFDAIKKPDIPHQFYIISEESNLIMSVGIALIPGDPPRYLVLGKHFDFSGIGLLAVIIGMIAIVIVIITTITTFFTLFYFFRKKNQEATSVLRELEGGNLDARFQISTFDEMSPLMIRFNEMADKIKQTVLSLRHSQQMRVELLQELSHDIQTPLTSLKMFSETLKNHHQKLDSQKLDHCFHLMNAEILYMERLTKDLLTLAQLHNPQYRLDCSLIELRLLIQEEMEAWLSLYPDIKTKIVCSSDKMVLKADEFLFRRLCKNIFSNAFRFARSRIEVTMIEHAQTIEIKFEDDGPGMSEEEIKCFGHKKFSRVLFQDKTKPINLGLGSVIMTEIVSLHGGTLQLHPSGHLAGVCLTLNFPR